ncbi:membrane-bound hydrogenase subunit mbhJ [Clostridium amylolyticum]|uniref:Membrane-bound hydrogenase subunit mbhJ n=1 Tax=Clostridium amylolyticum TaxID=1121298 RepID=A0A1M6CKY3_9CLOT|nr:NADH-quinone oxidoreductase subunit B family protein [Clostridium amylolyticum]SHI61424.1 membrane-bound hydrogenase subunit mbhJ [Clostridium amylolyticum]
MLDVIEKSRAKSPWIYHLNTGSCNGCDIELIALLGPKYDVERFGVKLTGTPRHADIIIVTGPVTSQSRERMLRVISQVPDPKVIVSLGSCPLSCNVFKGSYSVEGPLDRWVPVDVSVGGCSPKPEAIISGILKAVEILKRKRGVE